MCSDDKSVSGVTSDCSSLDFGNLRISLVCHTVRTYVQCFSGRTTEESILDLKDVTEQRIPENYVINIFAWCVI
jgi:hypothetical protein